MSFFQSVSGMIAQLCCILIEILGQVIDLADDLHVFIHRCSVSWWNASDMHTRPKPSARRFPAPCSSRMNNGLKRASRGCELANRKTEPVSIAYSLVLGVPHNSCQPVTRRTLAAW